MNAIETFTLPIVAGRKIRGSNDDFERACLVHIERLQHGLGDYDSAMLDTFCEAVRLVREYNDAMAMRNSACLHALVRSIESAPKDGTEILVWREDAGWLLARWIAPCDFLHELELERMELKDSEEPDWFYADFISGGRLDGGNPTHWIPMPNAPNQ